MDRLHACVLGPTPYGEGLRLQEALARARAAGETGDWLLFPDHPPVLTVGRAGDGGGLRVGAGELSARGIELHEVARGGDVTWHGPGQLVGYPIVGLERIGRDLHAFLRELEETLIGTLAVWGVAGTRVAGRTGVWVEGERPGEAEKIASIGVAVRRWVSYHGFALNVAPDLSGFDLIHPCGLRGVRMTSMALRLGGAAPALAAVRAEAAARLAERLGYAGLVWEPPAAARALAAHTAGAA